MPDIFIEAECLAERGGWVTETQSVAEMGSPYLMAHGLGTPVPDAAGDFVCPAAGRYRVYARTRDWTAVWGRGTPAGRFTLRIDEEELPATLGTNGPDWAFQAAGEVTLTAGRHRLCLHDLTGFNGRCDAVYMTTDAAPPPDGGEALAALRARFAPPDEEDAHLYDLIVVGGGMAGICMALAASRTGSDVLLIESREVLGGCNSSEIRVCLGGRIHLPPYPALGNVVKEVTPVMGSPSIFRPEYYEDDRKRLAFENHEGCPGRSRLALGRCLLSASVRDGCIDGITVLDVRTGRHIRYRARLFADCTGDALLSRMAGAAVMYGRESTAEFGETLGAPTHEKLVMGHSIRWYAVREDAPVAFPDIDFALPFDEESCYHVRSGDWEQESGFRRDMAEESEYIRDYGLLAIFSNWSYQKNHSARRAEYACDRLVFASPLGGKRESYRVVGDHILTQSDIEEHRPYPDATASMTWSIDIHFPEPDNEARFGEAFRSFAYHRGIRAPYAVPYRCLYARDLGNLFLGGRVISTTHVAFSAVRVMRTLGALGEAAGLAASVAARHRCLPREVYTDHLPELQEAMRRGVPSPDAFACDVGGEEAYHFKDLGWFFLDPGRRAESENSPYLDRAARNIRALGLAHRDTPPWLEET